MKTNRAVADGDDRNRPALLTFRGAGRTFTNGDVETVALADVDLEIFEGEMLCIVGPSGSGKSTLLNLAGGLDSPTSGEVRFRDFDLGRASSRELTQYRRRRVGFVFQFYNLVPNLTALENVEAVTQISDDPLDAKEALMRVGLGERLHHFPGQLSGGEQQRVAIARATAKNPDLLLCDEPTGALDFETGKKTLRTLVDLHREAGKTVVIITHNSALAKVCERTATMRSGRVVDVAHVAERIAPEEATW